MPAHTAVNTMLRNAQTVQHLMVNGSGPSDAKYVANAQWIPKVVYASANTSDVYPWVANRGTYSVDPIRTLPAQRAANSHPSSANLAMFTLGTRIPDYTQLAPKVMVSKRIAYSSGFPSAIYAVVSHTARHQRSSLPA